GGVACRAFLVRIVGTRDRAFACRDRLDFRWGRCRGRRGVRLRWHLDVGVTARGWIERHTRLKTSPFARALENIPADTKSRNDRTLRRVLHLAFPRSCLRGAGVCQ